MTAYDLSLVVACYNEANHLEDSLNEILTTLSETAYTYELIFIDDGSTDGTRPIIAKIADLHPHTRCVFHDQNVGRGGTVQEGFRLAAGRFVGFIDVDLEVHCRHIPAMLEALANGHDGATAFRTYETRFQPRRLLRHLLRSGYRFLFRSLIQSPFRDTLSGYKFFRRASIMPVLDEVEDVGWFWDTEIMVLAHRRGLRVIELPCPFVQRDDKMSTVRVFRDTWITLGALLTFRQRIKRRT